MPVEGGDDAGAAHRLAAAEAGTEAPQAAQTGRIHGIDRRAGRLACFLGSAKEEQGDRS